MAKPMAMAENARSVTAARGVEAALSALEGAEKILLTCHPRPDGDAAGSMIALASLLRDRGKRATLYSPLRVPRFLHWLPLRETWVHQLRKDANYDLTCIVDCGDEKLLGDAFPPREVTGKHLVIDHHAHGAPFGDIQLIDPDAAATGVLIHRIASLGGWELTPASATGIYVALISDTGHFRHANTNGEAFAVAGDLVGRQLISPAEIAEHLTTPYTGAKLRLLALALAKVERELGGRVALIEVTEELLAKAGASWDDTEGLIHYVRNLRGSRCGVFISPARGGGIRVSMRARPDGLDVGAVCAALGGGGHRGAAGATMQGSLAESRTKVLAAIEAGFSAETEAARSLAKAGDRPAS